MPDVPITDLSNDNNIISSLVIYMFKVISVIHILLKAQIRPYGNKHSHLEDWKSDCAICSPVAMHMTLSIASLYGGHLINLYVKTTFLKPVPAERDVHDIPPRESSD